MVSPFAPYCLRHTALTWLAARTDHYTLAKIAGHASRSISMRYCHPPADAVERAFRKMAEEVSEEISRGLPQQAAPQGAFGTGPGLRPDHIQGGEINFQ
jgi:integrase